jgi:hypothetical protein
MAYTTSTFGATNQYSVYHPEDNRMFIFSPYYIEVTGTAAQQQIKITINGENFVRFTNAAYKAKFPISGGVLKAFFAGVEFGDVASHETGKYTNAASKVIQKAKTITIQVESDVNTKVLTYDLIWGALQIGETEASKSTIYRFGTLPLTLTQLSGVWCDYDNGNAILENNTYGKEIDIQKAYTDNKKGIYKFVYGTDPFYVTKEISVVDLPDCGNGYYLRWLSLTEGYKYFYFQPHAEGYNTEDGASIKQNVWSLEPTPEGLLKSDTLLMNKKGAEVIECGIKNADYLQQKHLQTLQLSTKQWLYMGSNIWMEVKVEMDPITIDRFREKKEVIIKINKPALQLQSL